MKIGSRSSQGILHFVFFMLVLGASSDRAAAGVVQFSDGTMDPAAYSLFVHVGGGGGTTSQSISGGGNPGTYMYISNTVNTPPPGQYSIVYGTRLYSGAYYEPAQSGAIDSIDYSESSVMVNGFGDGQFSGPALYQNGNIYVAVNQATQTGLLRANQPGWTDQAVGGFTAQSFTLLGNIYSNTWTPNGSSHPDFSATGGAIFFGFYRSDSACVNCPGYTINAGIDNWFIRVNTKSQCQDGIDNDGDTFVDFPAEAGCSGAADDDERNPQCADGLDNDQDGAIDAADFSCDGQDDDDETVSQAECQDGLDNDNDGRVDFPADPDCTSKQDNTEAGVITQCNDGLDNDGDGAVDLADFGCSEAEDTNEADPKADCEDGLDNDGDGAADLQDFSCSDRQDNDETNLRSQCQDGIDNDNDGASDFPGDPDCSSKQDNNESNGAAQCQDGIDNDNDGASDFPNDFSCTSPEDDDEANSRSQCQDGMDNDGDATIDLADGGCSSKQDNTENSDFVAAPTGLQASDNDPTGIRVTWTGQIGANHKLYRSENPNDSNPALFVELALVPHGDPGPGAPTSGPTPISFFDTSAVPGRIYSYAAKAVNGSFLSTFSNVDSGLRPSDVPGGDCDGDGVSDAQEEDDGTLVCDGGSFQLHLRSPAFSKYNTFLSQLNYLELVGDGTLAVQNMKVTVYSIQGSPIASTTLTVAPQTQVDLDITAMVNQKDTYGVLKIEFDDTKSGATLKGRMTNYRPDPGKLSYSFAFTKELRNPTRGETYAGANSYDPQGAGYLVPNWMEVINLDGVDRSFVYSLYGQDGKLLGRQEFTLTPLAERDIQAGHEFGQGVYLGVVQPLDGAAKYFAGISRYSANSTSGSEAETYNYAFNLEARAGTGASQYATIANEVGDCFSQNNWFEVTNVRSVPVTATVTFHDQNGARAGSSSVVLASKSQYHFNASALLPKGSYGSVKLDSSMSGALIAQSLVYYQDCNSNRVQTAYAVQSRIAGQDVQTGSINSYLGMINDLRLINASTSPSSASVSVRPFGANQSLTPVSFALNAHGTVAAVTNGAGAAFVFPADSYGTLNVTTAQPKTVVPYVLRQRRNPEAAGTMDFVIPVAVQ